MSQPIVVGISDHQITQAPGRLITYALGSCVGICLHDPLKRIGGLSHILLPSPLHQEQSQEVFKYADRAIEAMIERLLKKGCQKGRLTAKIAGGATMFKTQGAFSIGDRNVSMVKHELKRLNIRLTAEDTGADYGRTVEFCTQSGIMTVRSVGRSERAF